MWNSALPVGWLEALPDVWAQEGALQGQGMCCSTPAPPTGAQPSCRGLILVSMCTTRYQSYFESRVIFSRVILCSVWVAVVNLKAIGVI